MGAVLQHDYACECDGRGSMTLPGGLGELQVQK